MKAYLARISVLVVFACAGCSAGAGELRMLPAANNQTISMAVSQRAIQDKLRDVVIFNKQSFEVEVDRVPVGTLVSGRGMMGGDGRDNSTCFIAAAKHGGSIELLLTIGANDWEAEACIDVNAVGLVAKNTVSGRAQIAIVYKAASPNAEVQEPVVFSWDLQTNQLEIDAESSRKASLAGAVAIPNIRKVLMK